MISFKTQTIYFSSSNYIYIFAFKKIFYYINIYTQILKNIFKYYLFYKPYFMKFVRRNYISFPNYFPETLV